MKLMRTAWLSGVWLLPWAAQAGALYGTARLGAAPLGGARILVACPGFAQQQAGGEVGTDGSGSFSLRVAANGRCQMRVEQGGRSGPPFEVYLSDKPLRFDFVLDQGLARVK